MARAKYKELGDKIKELRKSLGIETQEAFGEKKELKVTRSQISAWEVGKEPPSKEKLIALGNLASYPANLWFWERAGVDPKRVEAAIRRTLVQRPGEPTLSAVTPIPRLDALALLQRLDREERPGDGPVDSIPFPSLFIEDQPSTICIEVTKRTNGPLLFGGDLALVKLSESSLPALEGRLVAILFREQHNVLLPSSTHAHSQRRGPLMDVEQLERQRDWLELGEQSERQTNKYLREATAPGVLFGMLCIDSDERWDRNFNNLGAEHPWRFSLDCGATWEPLTDWSQESFSSVAVPEIKPGLRIVGAVTGWIRRVGASSDLAEVVEE